MSDPTPNHVGRRGFWIVIALFLGYIFSIGPVQSLHNHGYIAGHLRKDRVYLPIVWISDHGPEPIQNAIYWYVRLFDPTFSPYRTHGGVI